MIEKVTTNKILLVEDEKNWVSLLSRVFQKLNLSFVAVDSVDKALISIRDNDYNALFVNINLLDDSDTLGFDLLKHINHFHPEINLKFVLTGSRNKMRDNFAFRDLGVVKVLHKGKITFTELKKIIKEYFSQIERSIPLKKQITWLHLSDLHIKSNDPVESYNRRIILNALFDDIRNQISQGWVPDFIIFSGDLAYKGKKEEYDLAVNSFLEPLIKVTGLTRDNLFFVPGNHDIDRSTINNIESAGMRALLYNPDKITEFLLDLNKLPFYFSKFESYGTFFNESFGPHIEFSGSSYYYSKSFNLRGIKIGIMGLNSSWMSGYSSNDRGKIKDEGNLLLGEVQLNMALENVADSDLKIAIMHHPIRCCHPEEQDRIWSLFKKNCDFIVHGHVHNSRIYAHYDPQNSVLIIPSGSLYGEEGRKSLNGYNIVRYDFDEKQCKIKLRRYSDMGMSGPQWVKDIESSGEENNGILSFSA